MVNLNSNLIELKGVGAKFAERLKKMNIIKVRDLLWHFPVRYEDFSRVSKIANIKIGEVVTISGVVADIKLRRTWRRKMFVVEALVSDDSGSIKAIWFNQRFLLSILKKGRAVNLAGKVGEAPNGGICLLHPVYEIINTPFAEVAEEESTFRHTGRLIPVYPETKGITSKALRFLIKPLLEKLERLDDFIPQQILDRYNFPEINIALQNIHFPPDIEQAKIAKKRFAFGDLFLLHLTNLRQRLRLAKYKAYSFDGAIDLLKPIISKLPFDLTLSQKKVLLEILRDLGQSHPMNRLLQGDVGSGKTIIAALVSLVVAYNGKQVALLAPTEVLARQHYQTFKKFFGYLDITTALFSASERFIFYGDDLENKVTKKDLLTRINFGEIKIIVGTHALIQKNVKFSDLALVIVDEQHRFGVEQRAALVNRKEELVNDQVKDFSLILPHFLSMSATPIPRTLTLTMFGDLDLSVISELPKGRKEIITKIVAPSNRHKAYAFIRGQVKKGRQVFVICPRIDPAILEEEINNDTSLVDNNLYSKKIDRRKLITIEIRAAKEEYERLSKKIFPDLRVGLLHGKLKAQEKNKVMQDFKDGKIDILVSTSVVEVGVDVPNATIMMIEGSERFGLSQLYQFRGRVGRGEHQSFCFLFTDSANRATYRRLYSLLEAKNGFELAEKDLVIRGPGEFLGVSQTGRPDLAMKAIQNPELVEESRLAAQEILQEDPDLSQYPLLKKQLATFEREVHLE
jgi:ATP-dependent DNA helicase RecG